MDGDHNVATILEAGRQPCDLRWPAVRQHHHRQGAADIFAFLVAMHSAALYRTMGARVASGEPPGAAPLTTPDSASSGTRNSKQPGGVS